MSVVNFVSEGYVEKECLMLSMMMMTTMNSYLGS